VLPRFLGRFAAIALVSVAVAVAGVAMARAATRSATSQTATAIRVGDHPGYVGVVVDLRGTVPQANGATYATDTDPSDGRAVVRFGIIGLRTTAAPVDYDGVSARLSQGHNYIDLGLRVAPGRFKYLSWLWLGNDRLVVDLWKSAPPSAAAEIRGANGCLTLGAVRVTAEGVVTASGTESGVFEHQFVARVRAASGAVLAQQTVHSSGGQWSVALIPYAQRPQPATFEAVVRSSADGSLACLVQRRVALPDIGPAPLRLQYRAHADLDGSGHLDLITLRRISPAHGQITATLASGQVSITTDSSAVALPALVATGNVDGYPGDELFVDVEHISTNEFIGIYTYRDGALHHAATLAGYSAHPGLWAGMTCAAPGRAHTVVVHQFVEQGTGARAYWTRQDTVYTWSGPSLRQTSTGARRRIAGLPPAGLVGLHCGQAPLTATPAATAAAATASGAWRTLPAAPPPRPTPLLSQAAAWTGHAFVLFGRIQPHPPTSKDVALAYTPSTGAWLTLHPFSGPAGNFQGSYHALSAGRQVLVFQPQDTQAYTPATGRWSRLPQEPVGGGKDGLVAWTGHADRLGRRLLRRRAGHRRRARSVDRPLADPPGGAAGPEQLAGRRVDRARAARVRHRAQPRRPPVPGAARPGGSVRPDHEHVAADLADPLTPARRGPRLGRT